MLFSTKNLITIAIGIQFAVGAYVPTENWSTLTPTASIPADAVTDYPSTFGIAISKVAEATTTAAAAAKRRRELPQLVRRASQISDGQVQAGTTTTSSSKTSSKTTEAAASQITDGQVQATTGTTSTTSSSKSKTTEAAASQISDGQVQATTGTSSTSTKAKTTEAAASQIGDGQVQATTGTSSTKTTETAASQISDGQVQATTGSSASSTSTSTVSSSDEESDGQIIDEDGDEVDDPVTAVSCYSDSTLAMTLNDSILYDSAGRIGSIVANHQFQFDGPPPQAGAIYAAGWSISDDGYLQLGNSTEFYECLSGSFYNLYDEDIGTECYEIVLQIVDLVDC